MELIDIQKSVQWRNLKRIVSKGNIDTEKFNDSLVYNFSWFDL